MSRTKPDKLQAPRMTRRQWESNLTRIVEKLTNRLLAVEQRVADMAREKSKNG
jgi:hypothetical protein